MKKILKFTLLFSIIGLVIHTSSCEKENDRDQNLSLKEAKYIGAENHMAIDVKVNANLQLTAILTPGNTITEQVSYSNKHADLLTVTATGLLEPKEVGRDTLTVRTTAGAPLTVSYIINVLAP